MFSLDGVPHPSELVDSLRKTQDLVLTILLGIMLLEASSPYPILGYTIQHLLAEVKTTFVEAQLLKEYLSTVHLLSTQIEFSHRRDKLLYPIYEAAYTASMGEKKTQLRRSVPSWSKVLWSTSMAPPPRPALLSRSHFVSARFSSSSNVLSESVCLRFSVATGSWVRGTE